MICLKVYKLDPGHFVCVLGLLWQAALNKTRVNLWFLTGINMLLMLEKGIRRGICHAIHQYKQASKQQRDERIWWK